MHRGGSGWAIKPRIAEETGGPTWSSYSSTRSSQETSQGVFPRKQRQFHNPYVSPIYPPSATPSTYLALVLRLLGRIEERAGRAEHDRHQACMQRRRLTSALLSLVDFHPTTEKANVPKGMRASQGTGIVDK
jgi:hypothetical protein